MLLMHHGGISFRCWLSDRPETGKMNKCRVLHLLIVVLWLPGNAFTQSVDDCGVHTPASCIAAERFVHGTANQPIEIVYNYIVPDGFSVSQIQLHKLGSAQLMSLINPPAAPIIAGPFQNKIEVTDTGTDVARNLTLKILSVTADMLDTYRATVNYMGSDLLSAVTGVLLTLKVSPNPSLTISGYTTGVSAGQSLPLTCTSTQGKPPAQVAWWKGDVEQQQAVYSSTPDNSTNQGNATSVLTLTVQPVNNQETYQCRVSQLGTELERQDLQLNVRFYVEGSSITGYSGPVTSGSSLTLTCTSGSSNPPATISWTRVGGVAITGTDQPQTDGLHGGKITSQQIIFTNLQAEDNGAQFKCTVTNSAVSGSEEKTVTINVKYAPTNIGVACNPSDLSDLREGSALVCTCTADSYPPARYSWTYGTADPLPTGAVVDNTTGTLTFSNLDRAHSGEYSCAASNGISPEATSSGITVDVKYAPADVQVTCNPSDLSDLREGDRLQCTCTADSNPAAQYSWIYGTAGSLPTWAVVNQTAGTHTISALHRTHSGEYRCTASNGIGTGATSDDIMVDVKYAPLEPTIVSNATTVEEGDSVQLTCQTTSNPPASYNWTRQSKELPDDAREETNRTSVLVISGLTKDDSGTYICTASNDVLPGGAAKEYNLNVLYLYQPMISFDDVSINDGTPQQVRENTDASLTCAADANPTANIKWTGPQKEVTNGGQLQFNPIEKTHAGNYTCEASNSIKGEQRSKEVTLEITVNYAVNITFITPSMTVNEYDDVNLTCTADSNPTPKNFSWAYMNGTNLTATTSADGFSLTTAVTAITYLQMGTYTCTAGNGIGTAASAGTNVTVEYPPKFYPPSDPYPAAIGVDVSMQCSAFAVPNNIAFSWTKNGTTLTNSSRLTTQSSGETSVLTISGVVEGDYGMYNCTARNEKGSSSTTRTLQQLGPPGNPSGLIVLSKNTEFEVRIIWTAGFNGGLDTTHTVQLTMAGADQWEDVGSWQQTTSEQQRTFNITLDLKAQQAGDYKIRINARNTQGEAWSESVDLKLEASQRLSGRMTTNKNWVEALKDRESTEFRQKKALWEKNLDKVFSSLIGYEGATITQFSQGSIVGDFEAVVAESETQAAIEAFETQVNTGSVGDLTVIKESSQIAVTRPPDGGVNITSTTIIIIAAVCGVVVAVVVVSVCVCVCRKSANGKKGGAPEEGLGLTPAGRPTSLNGLTNDGLDQSTENIPGREGPGLPLVQMPSMNIYNDTNSEQGERTGAIAGATAGPLDPTVQYSTVNKSVQIPTGNPYDDVHFERDENMGAVDGEAAGPVNPAVQYATVNKNIQIATGNPYDDVNFERDDKTGSVAVATAGPLDPTAQYATVNKNKDNGTPNPNTVYAQVNKDKKKKDKEKPTLVVDPSSEYATIDKSKKKKKEMAPPPEDPSAQYSEVKKGKKKDKKASPVPEVIYTEVKKDKKDKKDKKKPAAAKKPNVKNSQEAKKNPQGLIYAELSDFQLKPPPKKPTKAVPHKPRYEDAPTEYAAINWNASRRRAQEQSQSGSDSDVETI